LIFSTFFVIVLKVCLNLNVTKLKGMDDMSVGDHCMSPEVCPTFGPLEKQKNMTEKSTLKTGFYIS
jgi:hypothetical protein